LNNWRYNGIVDDIRPLLLQSLPDHFAIATLVSVDGPSPRDVGAQMLITENEYWGFLSGGCVEEDIARHAREAMAEGAPRLLRYGEGSPWFDIKLACGAGISVLVEPVTANDPAIAVLLKAYRERQPVLWTSDGTARKAKVANTAQVVAPGWDGEVFSFSYEPSLRLLIIGSDATALALAALSLYQGTETILIAAGGPENAPFAGLHYLRTHAADALGAVQLDRWTAVAVVTHDRDDDERALAAALRSDVFYVGAIGSRARLDVRLARLQAEGINANTLQRLHAPVGLPGFGKSPREIALSIYAEVYRDFHSRWAAARSAGVSTSSVAPISAVGR
jgi:xanthine dehydrogenase accessory factor